MATRKLYPSMEFNKDTREVLEAILTKGLELLRDGTITEGTDIGILAGHLRDICCYADNTDEDDEWGFHVGFTGELQFPTICRALHEDLDIDWEGFLGDEFCHPKPIEAEQATEAKTEEEPASDVTAVDESKHWEVLPSRRELYRRMMAGTETALERAEALKMLRDQIETVEAKERDQLAQKAAKVLEAYQAVDSSERELDFELRQVQANQGVANTDDKNDKESNDEPIVELPCYYRELRQRMKAGTLTALDRSELLRMIEKQIEHEDATMSLDNAEAEALMSIA